MNPSADPYRTLGLPPGAPVDEVKRAYRRLAKLYHPDSTGGPTASRFIAIQRAYEALVVEAGQGGATKRPPPSTTRHPGSRRPTPGSRPGPRPWQADPERARATRESGVGGRERSRRADWTVSQARPGSTSYDGAEAGALDPKWDGANWYGAVSGTYWKIDPSDDADPRRHGPEYQGRGRRLPFDRSEAVGAEPTGSRADLGPSDPGWTAARAREKGTAGTAVGTAGGHDGATRETGSRRTRRDDPSSVGSSSAASTSLAERGLLAILGWLVPGLVAANLIGEVSGCARFLATCPEPVGLATILIQPLIVALLLLIPRLAEAAALGTIALLGAAIPAAVLLSALGAGSAPAGQAAAGLGLLLAIPYVAAFVAGISGRLRVPIPAGGRVR